MQFLNFFFLLFVSSFSLSAQNLPLPTDTCAFCIFPMPTAHLNVPPQINLYCIHPDINCHIKCIKQFKLNVADENADANQDYTFKGNIAHRGATAKPFDLSQYLKSNSIFTFTDIWVETSAGKLIKIEDFIIYHNSETFRPFRSTQLNDSLLYYARYQRNWIHIKNTHPQLIGKSSEHLTILSFRLGKKLIKSDKFDANMYGRNRRVTHIKALYKKEPIELPDYELK